MIDDLELNIIDYTPNVTNSNIYNKLRLGEDLDNYFMIINLVSFL